MTSTITNNHLKVRRVLLVEDNPADAHLVKIMLRKSTGTYAVECVERLAEALEALAQRSFDIVLLDLSLPDAYDLSGFALLQQESDVPVIIMSGRSDESTAISALAAGAQDYLIKDHANSHFLHRAIGYAIERKAGDEKLAFLARNDAVTGLRNRLSFLEQLRSSLKRAERDKSTRSPAVFLLDLDGFKSVNDTLGHSVGDELLAQVALRLQNCIREADCVARIGGDEFALLLDDTEGESVVAAAVRIIDSLAEFFHLGQNEMRIGASIGIAFPTEAYCVKDLLRNADLAMYRAKERGGSTYSFFDQEMHQRAQRKQMLEHDISEAEKNGEFRLFYQSINCSKTQMPKAFEALLRWEHPRLGLISPDDFVPILEKTGLIVSVGRWVLKHACAQLAQWQKEHLPELKMAVNFSPRQFEDPKLVEMVTEAIEDSGILPSSLEVEVTESLLMKNLELAEESIKGLRALGVGIAIDDFGTGYSQLVYLVRFPISTLKVDRSVTDTIGSCEGDKLVKAVIDLGHSLGFSIVGEGVETQEQLNFLCQKKCETYQGYLTSRPEPPDAVGDWLSSLG